MNKKILIPVISGIAIVIIVAAFMIPTPNDSETGTLSVSYTDTNKELQAILATEDVAMSSALKLNGLSIKEYCTFFADEAKQNAIEYCTSTELLDSEGQFLGNIQMVGLTFEPQYILGVIQADPFMSQLDDIKIIYGTMIENVVCDCWEEEKPGGFESVSAWIDAAKEHHLEAKKVTSKSKVSRLTAEPILLEITTNEEGYLWKFIIPI